MYFRYIGHGDNAKSALLYSRVNKLGHTGTIDKNDITSRTNVVFISNIENYSAAKMENLIFNTFMYNKIKDKQQNVPTETEYSSYKKLVIFLGKCKLKEVMSAFNSSNSCIGLKEAEGVYRFVYFSKN
tara:strand:- start:583 stop:966 length:384 start_codon:yes stop_codon:yes gene_type:complete